MNKAILKTERSIGSKSRVQRVTKELRGEERSAIPTAWKQTIEKLLTRQFDTLSDAVEAVVGEIGSQASSSPQELEFLKLALETDPVVCQQLRAILTIKN